MSVSRRWEKQVRAAVADVREARSSGPNLESEAWRAFESNAQMLAPAPIEQTERARQVRAINRIAMRYRWEGAIAHFLDTKGVGYVADLSDPQVDDLHGRMEGYLEAAMAGCDMDDEIPAR